MPKFKVDVSDPAVTRGLTPYVVEAKDEEHAKEVLAQRNDTTIEGLAAEGLIFWTVTQVPEEFVDAKPTPAPGSSHLSPQGSTPAQPSPFLAGDGSMITLMPNDGSIDRDELGIPVVPAQSEPPADIPERTPGT